MGAKKTGPRRTLGNESPWEYYFKAAADFLGAPDGTITPNSPADYYSRICAENSGKHTAAITDTVARILAEAVLGQALVRNHARMAFGRLAQKRGQRAEIRKLGDLLVKESLALNRATRFSDLLAEGVLEFEPSSDILNAYRRLARISKRRFDDALLRFLVKDLGDEFCKLPVKYPERYRPQMEYLLRTVHTQFFHVESLRTSCTKSRVLH